MARGQLTKQKIQDCALHLFVEQGIKSATIRDIAHAAHISEGALYRHYPSKEALAKDLFLTSYKALSVELRQRLAPITEFEVQIKVIIHYFCEKYDNHPVLFQYLLITQHHYAQLLSAQDQTPLTVIKALLQQAIDTKACKINDPMLGAAILYGIVLQSASFRIYGHIQRSMSEDAPILYKAAKAALVLSAAQ
jgi:AcrR family transcriptional regulator